MAPCGWKKRSDTGDALSGVTIQIKHIETGETRTEQTRNGVVVFDGTGPRRLGSQGDRRY